MVDPLVRRRMQQQKRQGTEPEMRLRRALHAAGHRYRVGYKVPGAPRRTIDVAFPRQRLAVFVDGCFWHACPEHGVRPKNNAEWWSGKLRRNVERDLSTDEILLAAAWTVVRVWEHSSTAVAVETVEMGLGLSAVGGVH